MIETFIDPYTKKVLEKDEEGNLISVGDHRHNIYRYYDGCYDFSVVDTNASETRVAYDDRYDKEGSENLSFSDVSNFWVDSTVPWRRTMLDSLGSLSGRRVLLIGNGASYREFYFLLLGAKVVFTDLSLVAVKRAQYVFRRSELYNVHYNNIEFHAVDAVHLPFPDETFDVVYGTKVVGFLDNIPEFLSEVKRCLKPGGICRFTDDAFSPTWDTMRRFLFLPIKAHLLWKSMPPIERIRSGGTPYGDSGFKEEDFQPFVKEIGFKRLVFIREYFFLRIAQLFWGKIVRWNPKKLRYAKPIYLAMKWLDHLLENTKWMKRNKMALIWGFDKKTSPED